MSGVTVDITQRKRAEEEQARLREELIASQGHLLAELSTPLIPISDQVLAMPLIGAIDQARAERVVEILLQGISARGARVAILDITGVPTVDTKVADTLMRAARGVQLLGAEVVLTGIRAEVAQTLVALGVDLGSIATRGTLQDGIRYATRRR
jgi:rsbT co-antagonist protein RsbR